LFIPSLVSQHGFNHKRSVQELQEGWDEGWDEGFNGRGQLIKVEKIAFSGMSDMYFN